MTEALTGVTFTAWLVLAALELPASSVAVTLKAL
jgi:hypothetical protein